MPKMFGIGRRKMLEIPVNQAHLVGLPICAQAPSIVRDFVCELFTIHRFAAFAGFPQLPTCSTNRRCRRWRSGWSRPPSAPAQTPQTRLRSGASRRASKCATAGSRNPSAPKATMSDCACWSGNARPWSRPTMFPAMGLQNSPSGRSRWLASRLTTNMSVSPIRRCWRTSSPISICSTAKFPRRPNWSAAPAKRKPRGSRSRA